MDREQIMQEIARLDQQIRDISARGRAGRLTVQPFPIGAWIGAMVCLAYWLFGGMIEQEFHAWAQYIGLVLGILLLLSAVLQSIKWIGSRGGGKTRDFEKNMQEAQILQAKRDELQAQLDKKPG